MTNKEEANQIQVNFRGWNDQMKHKQTLEELFDGNVRYLKLIKHQLGDQAAIEGFRATVDFTFNKNMSGLLKLGDSFLKSVSKLTLLEKITTNFFINMQHIVKLECIKKLDLSPATSEIIIKNCTGKKAWITGLKNNKATDLFSDEDYCKYTCVPTLRKFLEVAHAKNTAEFTEDGCHQVIKFLEE
ncbi:MAG: hypothetical protein ACTSRS_02730 [Candidatus Helarchaeota archaeon]